MNRVERKLFVVPLPRRKKLILLKQPSVLDRGKQIKWPKKLKRLH